MTDYVLGFLFNKHKTQVILINKLKPEWQKGFFNGVGGKIEESEAHENPNFAMVREFEEETGALTEREKWQQFAIMDCGEQDKAGKGSTKVFCFRYFSDLVYLEDMNIQQMESEKPEIVFVENIKYDGILKVIPNLNWLIRLAMDEEPIHSVIKYR